MASKKNILVFAPHPDDETFGCGGIIAKRNSEGYHVAVIVLTDGRHAFSKVLGINSDPAPEELRQIRKEETIKAVEALGVSNDNLLFLDFEDGTLGEHKKEVEEKISVILKNFPPVEVYFPYINDFNIDHQVTNRIVNQCLQKSGLAPFKFQYSIMHKYTRIGLILEKLLDFLMRRTVEVDISQFVDLKKKAVTEFKSQISIISEKQKRPVISSSRIERFLANEEKFYVDRSAI